MNSEARDRIVDGADLAAGAYRDSSNLDRRKGIYIYSSPYFNIEDEVIRAQQISDGMSVLDVGVGNASLLMKMNQLFPNARLSGIDISGGLIEAASNAAAQVGVTIDFKVGSAESIPFGNEEFDRVVMMHMLYHVPDILLALAEASRVLSQDGKIIITANSRESRPVLRHLKSRAAEIMGTSVFIDPNERFNLQNGPEMLKDLFESVDVIEFPSTLRLDSSVPYTDYFDSLRDFWDPAPADSVWEEVIGMVKEYIDLQIAQEGEFTEATGFGIIIGAKPLKNNYKYGK